MSVLFLTLGGCVESDPQSGVDERVVYGVLDTEVFLYDQQLIGLPTGPQDVTDTCPLGGEVHVVGTTAEAEQATVDLVFSLSACANTGDGYDLVLTGALTMDGSFSSAGDKALSTVSDDLAVSGTVDVDGETLDVEEACALAVTDRGSAGEASVVSGKWCGREVSF